MADRPGSAGHFKLYPFENYVGEAQVVAPACGGHKGGRGSVQTQNLSAMLTTTRICDFSFAVCHQTEVTLYIWLQLCCVSLRARIQYNYHGVVVVVIVVVVVVANSAVVPAKFALTVTDEAVDVTFQPPSTLDGVFVALFVISWVVAVGWFLSVGNVVLLLEILGSGAGRLVLVDAY